MNVEKRKEKPPVEDSITGSRSRPFSRKELKALPTLDDKVAAFLAAVLFQDRDIASLDRRVNELKQAFGIGSEEVDGKFFIPPVDELRKIELDSIEIIPERIDPKYSDVKRFNMPVLKDHLRFSNGDVDIQVAGTAHLFMFKGGKALRDFNKLLMQGVDGHEVAFDKRFGEKREILDKSDEYITHLSKSARLFLLAQRGGLAKDAVFVSLSAIFPSVFKNPIAEVMLKDGRISFDALINGTLDVNEGLQNVLDVNERLHNVLDEMFDVTEEPQKTGFPSDKLKITWWAFIARSAEMAHTINVIGKNKATPDETRECRFLTGVGHLQLIKYFLDHPRERHLTLLQMTNLVDRK